MSLTSTLRLVRQQTIVNQSRAYNEHYLRRKKKIEDRKLLVEEWINMVTHFYGHLISDGKPLSQFNQMSMKEFETLIVAHTHMITNDLAVKERKKKEETERREKQLLERLKQGLTPA